MQSLGDTQNKFNSPFIYIAIYLILIITTPTQYKDAEKILQRLELLSLVFNPF